jgi:hypothetical protein
MSAPTYYFRMKATNATGSPDYSNTAHATTQTPPTHGNNRLSFGLGLEL